MKILELKLKKDVLIVEIPRLADYEFINKECKYIKIYIKTGNEEVKLNASTLDKFEFLCKGSELTEEIASELVKTTWIHDKKILCKYKNYNSEGDGSYFSAVKSFKSAIESKGFYWLENKWQEAEEKTFKNPLIFVKK